MSIVFVQPKAKETVVDTVNALFVRDEILFQQSLDGGLYGTRSGQAVLFDEFRGLNGADIAFLVDGDEHLFLPFRKPEQNLPESNICRNRNLCRDPFQPFFDTPGCPVK